MDYSVRRYVSAAAPDDNPAILDNRRYRARPAAAAASEYPPSVKRIGLRRRWKRGDLNRRLTILFRVGQESQSGFAGMRPFIRNLVRPRSRSAAVMIGSQQSVARSERFELPTLGIEIRCSIQLSYERVCLSDYQTGRPNPTLVPASLRAPQLPDRRLRRDQKQGWRPPCPL